VAGEIVEAAGGEVAEVALEVGPDPFVRVEFGGVGRQAFETDAVADDAEELAELYAAMDRRAVPDNQQLPAGVSQQVVEERDDRRRVECLAEQLLRVESAVGRDRADAADVVASPGDVENRGVAAFGPSVKDRRIQVEAGLVDEADRAAFFFRPFFRTGQRS